MSGKPTGLEHWMQLQHLTEDEVIARYKPAPNAIEHEVGYYGLKPATCIQTREGDFFFQDGQLGMIFVSDWSLQQGDGPTKRDPLLKALGTPADTLQSRAGRPNRLYVFPEHGIAFSASTEGIDYVELFPPIDLDTYKRVFYNEPPEFRR